MYDSQHETSKVKCSQIQPKAWTNRSGKEAKELLKISKVSINISSKGVVLTLHTLGGAVSGLKVATLVLIADVIITSDCQQDIVLRRCVGCGCVEAAAAAMAVMGGEGMEGGRGGRGGGGGG